MAYIVHAIDRADSESIRQSNRAAHLEFLKQAGNSLLLAGPVLADDGTMAGSLLIVDYDSDEAVISWLADDPYTRAGLFASVTIMAFKPVIANLGAI